MNLLDLSPVIPVVVIEDPETAVPLARALLDGGIAVIEVTLRTDAALAAVERIATQVPGMTLGAGTVCTAAQARASVVAGAQFLVSPGATDRLLDALQEQAVPFLAGVATLSEMLRLLEREITEAKLFPAGAIGALALLDAVSGPLPGLRFCPTGGISAATAPDYLARPNVGCVGGTWLTPAAALAARDWARITDLARAAAELGVGR